MMQSEFKKCWEIPIYPLIFAALNDYLPEITEYEEREVLRGMGWY